MTVPGVYSPEQDLGLQGKQTGYRVQGVPGFGGGVTWYLCKYGSVVSQHFSEAQAQTALRIAERKDTAMQAHVDKVIASDGVDDSRAVEVMQSAIEDVLAAWLREDGSVADNALGLTALGALRALEGE